MYHSEFGQMNNSTAIATASVYPISYVVVFYVAVVVVTVVEVWW